jgi:hypothetical protein
MQITAAQAENWATGTPEDWAMEAFMIAKQDAYGDPPLSKSKRQHLDDAYVAQAEKDVALQLSKSGVRLASLLNAANPVHVETGDHATCGTPRDSQRPIHSLADLSSPGVKVR